MKKLEARLGYILKNTLTEECMFKVYLPDNADTSIYIEIPRTDLDYQFLANMQVMQQKEESLNKIGKIVASQVIEDDIALTIKEFYDEWQVNITYKVGQYINYKDVLYKVLTGHTSQEGWTPDVTGSLYTKVLIDPTGETILEWVQPDSTNAYMKGDKVKHKEQIYVSTVDNNVWEPGIYGWEIEKEE